MSQSTNFVPSKRLANNLYVEGYVFQCIRTSSNNVVYWRCQESRGSFKCPAKCQTKDEHVLSTTGIHNHPVPQKADIAFRKAIGKAKERIMREKGKIH